MHRSTVLAVALFVLGCTRDQGAIVTLPEGTKPAVRPGARTAAGGAQRADAGGVSSPALFDQGIEGTVILRLFADSTGKLVPDSTRVQESSGYPALDSAAVAASPSLLLRAGAPRRRSRWRPRSCSRSTSAIPGAGGTTP